MSAPAEMGVLGCALMGAMDECLAEGITGEHFANSEHRRIWEAIREVTEKGLPCSVATVHDRLNASGRSDPSYLIRCEDAAPTSTNLGYWLPLLKKSAVRRLYKAKMAKLGKALDDQNLEPDELTAAFEAEILDLSGEDTKKTTRSDSLVRVLANIEQVQFKGKVFGLTTGFPELDNVIGGLHNGEMMVIAARPGCGKTAIAANMAENLVSKGVPVGFFSQEMTEDQLNFRMLCTHARQDSRELMRPHTLTPRDFPKISAAVSRMNSWPLHIRDKGDMTIGQIRAEARTMRAIHGCEAFFVDYLQLIHPDKRGEKRYQEVGAISAGLKNMAKELNCPVVALAQLNRETVRANRAPRAYDLRESGNIEADADQIMLLWEPTGEEMAHPTHAMVEGIIDKNRNGGTGRVNFLFRKEHTQFETVSPIKDEDIPPSP